MQSIMKIERKKEREEDAETMKKKCDCERKADSRTTDLYVIKKEYTWQWFKSGLINWLCRFLLFNEMVQLMQRVWWMILWTELFIESLIVNCNNKTAIEIHE